jgi:hypothetical protein
MKSIFVEFESSSQIYINYVKKYKDVNIGSLKNIMSYLPTSRHLEFQKETKKYNAELTT